MLSIICILDCFPPPSTLFDDMTQETPSRQNDAQKTPSRPNASSYEHPLFSKVTSIPPFTTPMNKGTASQVRYDTEATREFVDPYIMQDLKTHKVYVPFSVFLRVVFGLPTDWEKNPDVIRGVEAIENSKEYQQSLGDYLKLCKTERDEKKLYPGHVATRNYAALAVANADGTDTGLSVHTYRQDARALVGIPVSRSPDLCSVLKIVFDESGNDMKKTNESGPAEDKRFAVAHINHWNDVKADTQLLDGGVGAFVVMEKLPDGTYQDPRQQKNIRYARRNAEKASTPVPSATPTASSNISGKRSRAASNVSAGTLVPQKKRPKTPHPSNNSTVAVVSNSALGVTDLAHEADGRLKVSYQCARYGYHNLSHGGLRSHSIGFLICKDYIQLFLHERSVIMVSAPLCFREQPRLFAVIQVCLQRMTLADRGIMSSFLPDPIISSYSAFTPRMLADRAFLFEGRQMTLTVNGTEHTIQLGRVIARHPGLIGRTTIVYEVVTQAIWPGREIVVKVNFPSDRRTSEAEFVEKIREAVVKGGKDCEWVLNHIPDILHVQDDIPIPNSVLGRVAKFFRDDGKEIVWVGDEPFDYEQRVCRVTVHEKLEPFNSLQTVQDYTQIIFDVLQVHRWIYDHPKILHRDISEGNIMWRRRNGRICGVLNDFDLASFLQNINQTSKMRTGTRPYLAHELHPTVTAEKPPTHLYRHDLESLFYVLLLLVTVHGLQKIPEEEPPRFDLVLYPDTECYNWFTLDDKLLNREKVTLLTRLVPLPATATFTELGGILKAFHRCIRTGITARLHYADMEEESVQRPVQRKGIKMHQTPVQATGEPPFDDATLGGKFTYHYVFQAFVSMSSFDLEQNYIID